MTRNLDPKSVEERERRLDDITKPHIGDAVLISAGSCVAIGVGAVTVTPLSVGVIALTHGANFATCLIRRAMA